ncbi:hypothetical protein EJB05_27943, partial [Eragrostis curvula]
MLASSSRYRAPEIFLGSTDYDEQIHTRVQPGPSRADDASSSTSRHDSRRLSFVALPQCHAPPSCNAAPLAKRSAPRRAREVHALRLRPAKPA